MDTQTAKQLALQWAVVFTALLAAMLVAQKMA